MRSTSAFNLLLLIGIAQAVSIETINYNGSTYYHATNNGTIEPQTFFNKTDLFNGKNVTDALSRDWLSFQFGLATLSGGHINYLTFQGLEGYNIYGYSDNATYWRGEINRSFTLGTRTANLSLNYFQGERDDFINETWRLSMSAAYVSATDVYYVEALTGISYLDEVSVENETWGTGRPLSEDNTYRNVTAISVMNLADARGWQYLLDRGDYGNIVLVRNRTVYIGLNLGKTLSGTIRVSVQKIDAVCAMSCGGGDALIYTVVSANNSGIAPFNDTTRYTVTDSLGTCSYSSGCYWTGFATDYYNKSLSLAGYQRLNDSKEESGGNWIQCNSLDPSGCSYPATDNENFVQEVCPLYSTCYTNLTVKGNYTLIVFWTQRTTWRFNNVLKATITYAVNDSTNAKIECNFTNNTVQSLENTNGSNYWANWTPPCNATGGGLVNNTGWFLNTTGTWTSYNLMDNVTGNVSNQLTLQNATYYQYCIYVNQTNYKSYAGALSLRGTNSTCWIFGIKITMAIIGGGVVTPMPTAPYDIDYGEEDEPNPFNYLVLLAMPLLAIISYRVIG